MNLDNQGTSLFIRICLKISQHMCIQSNFTQTCKHLEAMKVIQKPESFLLSLWEHFLLYGQEYPKHSFPIPVSCFPLCFAGSSGNCGEHSDCILASLNLLHPVHCLLGFVDSRSSGSLQKAKMFQVFQAENSMLTGTVVQSV